MLASFFASLWIHFTPLAYTRHPLSNNVEHVRPFDVRIFSNLHSGWELEMSECGVGKVLCAPITHLFGTIIFITLDFQDFWIKFCLVPKVFSSSKRSMKMFRSNFDGWNQPSQKEMSWWMNFVNWVFVDKRLSKDSWMHIWNHEMLWCSMDKCYGNLRDYLRWLDECDYVKKTSMDEIVHCDELWYTIMNDNETITTFEMFNQSCKNGWLWCQ